MTSESERERERERERVRSRCCSKEGLNRGAWTAVEDKVLREYIEVHGEGRWRKLPKLAGQSLNYIYIHTDLYTLYAVCYRTLEVEEDGGQGMEVATSAI